MIAARVQAGHINATMTIITGICRFIVPYLNYNKKESCFNRIDSIELKPLSYSKSSNI
jgi:hypothetical protein